MLLKLGVSLAYLRPEIRKKLALIEMIHMTTLREEAIITSTNEGTHMPGSLHYANLAIDIRKHKGEGPFISHLIEKLGDNYDVVVKTDHIHIEYDPKREIPRVMI